MRKLATYEGFLYSSYFWRDSIALEGLRLKSLMNCSILALNFCCLSWDSNSTLRLLFWKNSEFWWLNYWLSRTRKDSSVPRRRFLLEMVGTPRRFSPTVSLRLK